MKTYPVIAEMVDAASGKRYFSGETFTTSDTDQAARLAKAGCLGEGADYVAPEEGGDGLDKLKVDELKAIAEAEKVELPADAKKADIVAAIRAARVAA